MTTNVQWLGRDCKFVWRRAANTGSSEMGSEPYGANSGAPDPAIDYLIRIEKPDATVLRQEYVKENAYTYTFEKNFEDTHGAPVRDFTFKVWARNPYAISSLPAQLGVTNPAPAVPGAIFAVAGADNITVSCSPASDTDFAGLVIYRSTSGGFVPGPGNLVYQGPNSSIAFTGLAPNNQYFFRLAAFDTFGTDQLNVSSEFSATTDYNVSQLSVITQDLGDITAGSMRGVNVNASSHTTKGSYLTSSLAGGEATLNVRNTADFPSSGSGVIIDTTNDRDAFTYTGKTATTLTGCAGVLAHNNGATIIPLAKGMVIDAATNEMRFYGDRGDGTIEELAAIGINAANVVGSFGTTTSGQIAVHARTSGAGGAPAILASSNGSTGAAVIAESNGSGDAVVGSALGSGCGGRFVGNATRGNLNLTNAGAFPSDASADQLHNKNGRLYYSNGSAWLPLTRPYFISADQTITAAGALTLAHGMPAAPTSVWAALVCQTGEHGYTAGDVVFTSSYENNDAGAVNRGHIVVADATNLNVRFGSASNSVYTLLDKSTGTGSLITNANWKVRFYAS